MKEVAQEIRVSSIAIEFTDDSAASTKTIPSVIITGAVITLTGEVHEFLFERGKLSFKNNKKTVNPFNKTAHQQLEYLLLSYTHGVLKINTIRCNIETDVCEYQQTSELEED